MEGFDSRVDEHGEQKRCEMMQHWWGKVRGQEETVDIDTVRG